MSGYDQEIKVITPWPAPANNAISIKIYDARSNLYTPKDGDLVVDVFDDNGNKIAESQVSPRGEADFANLKVGDYLIRAQSIHNNAIWGDSKIMFDGKKTTFAIYETLQSQQN